MTLFLAVVLVINDSVLPCLLIAGMLGRLRQVIGVLHVAHSKTVAQARYHYGVDSFFYL